jgi:hypothetical protein
MQTTKNFGFIFLFSFISAQVYSQNGKSISFEAGAVFNTMLSQRASLEECKKYNLHEYEASGCFIYSVVPYYTNELSSGDNLVRYGQDIHFFNTVGSYAKVNYEKVVYSKNGFYLSIPIGLSYINQTDKFKRINWYQDANTYTSIEKTVELNSKSINLFIGGAINYSVRRFDFYAGLNYYVLRGLNHYTVLVDDGNKTSSFSYNYLKARRMAEIRTHCLSSNIGFKINLKKSMAIGPNLEIFIANSIKGLMNRSAYNGTYTSYMLGLNGKNLWINPGFKLQIDLK